MGQVFPPAVRDRCPTCGLEVAYMPLGKECLFCGFLWMQAIRRWWRNEGVLSEPDRQRNGEENLGRFIRNEKGPRRNASPDTHAGD